MSLAAVSDQLLHNSLLASCLPRTLRPSMAPRDGFLCGARCCALVAVAKHARGARHASVEIAADDRAHVVRVRAADEERGAPAPAQAVAVAAPGAAAEAVATAVGEEAPAQALLVVGRAGLAACRAVAGAPAAAPAELLLSELPPMVWFAGGLVVWAREARRQLLSGPTLV